MTTNFFQDALRQGMAARHFNQAQLAEFLGVDPAYVSRWLKGSSPRIDQMKSVLSTLGWKIERARPDYDAFDDAIARLDSGSGEGLPESVKEKGKSYQSVKEIKSLLSEAAEKHKRMSQPPVRYIGRVGASALVEYAADDDQSEFDSCSAVLTTLDYAANEISVLNVESNDLAPVFPTGSRLFVRKITKPGSVPDGAIVVLEASRKPGVFHVRRLVRIAEGHPSRVERLIGAPLVETQEYLFFRPREVRLAYVVVAVLENKAVP